MLTFQNLKNIKLDELRTLQNIMTHMYGADIASLISENPQARKPIFEPLI